MNKKVFTVCFSTVFISMICIAVWQICFNHINYYLASMLILMISLVPFFALFEIKKTTSREVTLIAVLITLAVVSRTAFYLVPQVKPMGAVVILSAICLGAERGYIVGAFSAFISNFIFGQGFWTPFQMVAFGTVGLCAGLIFKFVKANRITMPVIGFLLIFVFYGLIVDFSTILMTYGNNLSMSSILSIYMSGAPFNAVFGLSTAVFLFILGEPFIKKLDRVNTKYALINNKNI